MKNLKNYLLCTFLFLFVSAVGMANNLLLTSLTGSEEVPGPGDEDGYGKAILLLKPQQQKICFVLFVTNIETPTAAHIHEGDNDDIGPVVVSLEPPVNGLSDGCIEDVGEELINDIAQNPEEYYVNVHNDEFPSGALRGQLGSDDDDGQDDDEEDEDEDKDEENLCYKA